MPNPVKLHISTPPTPPTFSYQQSYPIRNASIPTPHTINPNSKEIHQSECRPPSSLSTTFTTHAPSAAQPAPVRRRRVDLAAALGFRW
ncbi:hypothetical protein GQ44DRAFT_292848 [Phaeosphaeriaceae sp. PMI808]|nr:hypothetical protein GQ44DRAFT_292848 [Phaeosphaeriaceae sp. PMI808]